MMFTKNHAAALLKRMTALVLALLIFGAAGVQTAAATQLPSQDPQNTPQRAGPVLMVTDYSVIGEKRGPGSSFILQMNISNLSELASAHNVVATLTIENESVSLQEGITNQLFFREILPRETVAVQFPMDVYSYCKEENVILTMTMTCYDDASAHYVFQTMMTPGIDVERTLNVTSLTIPQFVQRDSSMIISATLRNMELVTLNNIKMHVVTQYGDQITEVGSLLKEESRTVNCVYRFPELQTEDVQVYFTYESLYGHEFTTEPQSFQVVVFDPDAKAAISESKKLSMDLIFDRLIQGIPLPNTDFRIPIPVFVLILAGGIGYGAVAYYVFFKKKEA